MLCLQDAPNSIDEIVWRQLKPWITGNLQMTTKPWLCRGRPYVDGSLADFLRGDNSHWLTCEGQAVVLDYFQVKVVITELCMRHHCICEAQHIHVATKLLGQDYMLVQALLVHFANAHYHCC